MNSVLNLGQQYWGSENYDFLLSCTCTQHLYKHLLSIHVVVSDNKSRSICSTSDNSMTHVTENRIMLSRCHFYTFYTFIPLFLMGQRYIMTWEHLILSANTFVVLDHSVDLDDINFWRAGNNMCAILYFIQVDLIEDHKYFHEINVFTISR